MFVRDKIKKIVHPEDAELPPEQQRFITVQSRMTQGQKAAFWDEVAAVQRSVGTCSDAHYDLLLLAHNVTGWGGSGTEDFPFSEGNISELDANDALVLKVIDYLTEANKKKESPDPKSATAPTSTTSSTDGSAASLAA